jgi:hypothetical protein
MMLLMVLRELLFNGFILDMCDLTFFDLGYDCQRQRIALSEMRANLDQGAWMWRVAVSVRPRYLLGNDGTKMGTTGEVFSMFTGNCKSRTF